MLWRYKFGGMIHLEYVQGCLLYRLYTGWERLVNSQLREGMTTRAQTPGPVPGLLSGLGLDFGP